MSKTTRKRIILSIILLTLSLTPAFLVGADIEPNDNFAGAELIESAISQGVIDEGDVDIYRFYPVGMSDLSIMVHPTYELTLTASIYDVDENLVTEQSTSNPGDIISLYLDSAEEEYYFIEIYSPQENESGEYTVDISEKMILSVLAIKVVDIVNEPIDGATVRTTETPSTESSMSTLTDMSGEAVFTELEEGSYTFVIEKTGYMNATIGQSFESAGRSTITVTLNNEPEVPVNEGSFVERNQLGLGLLALVLILVGAGWWYYSSNKQKIPPIEQE